MSFALRFRTDVKNWSTPRWLWSFMALVLGMTFLHWAAATGVLVGGGSAVSSVRDRGVPAYVSARTAHAALSDADRAAWQSFRSGAAELIGPGQRFRDNLTTAGDSLAHIAERDFGGPAERDLLRAVNAQVVTYQGLVEQADATYREGLEDLGYAYLSYASDLLHGDGGVLARIDEIADRDRRAIDQRRHSAWGGTAAALGTALAGFALLAVLVYAQVAMARRFRRVFNLPLLAACLVLLGLVLWAANAFLHLDRSFDRAWQRDLPAFDRVVAAQSGTARAGASALRAGGPVDQAEGLDVTAVDEARRPLDARLTGAGTGALAAGLPLLSLAVAGLAGLGFWLRLREFRR
ncbi:hypothetical protein E1200_09115 [Actinomadura sp. GC306]|uniref:hypothetical protein n=1 Tax=Actinomadura sp. GC306 TaxID=2530367 RepID=UPI0010446F38|nr:hypothetical protein [Actinomadura sp. GC306]TDC69242.1 hypothetical protein E1200_09115 [Actinomadura sp. GC306]